MKIQDVRQLILETEGCLKCPKKVFHHLLIFSYRCRGTHRVKEALVVKTRGCGGGGGGSVPCWKHRQEHAEPGGEIVSLCKLRIPLEKKSPPPFPHSKSPTSINKAMVSYRVAMLSRRRVGHSVCVHVRFQYLYVFIQYPLMNCFYLFTYFQFSNHA